MKGIYIQEDLQRTIGLHLMNRTHDRKSIRNVIIKIRYQFLRHYFPGERGTFYYKHGLMAGYGIIGRDTAKDKYQVIRKITNELRDPDRNYKQGKGNRSDEDIEKESYHPKAIEKVLYTDSSGIQRYYIPLLRVAIEAAADTFLSMSFDSDPPIRTLDFSSKDIDQFLHAFMKNEIVSLYTKNAPPRISELVKDFAYEVVEGYFI